MQDWMKSMYRWELCWCLRDTDPEPEYQGHWHYEDPEGSKEREDVNTTYIKSIQYKFKLCWAKMYTYSMRGHLAVFAEILSSNQLLWDGFSSLEKHS